MSTIDEIMACVYRSQFAASAYEASSGPGTGKLEIDMFAADGEVQAIITSAIAEARREGAEAMRGRCEELVRPVEWLSRDESRISDGHELADTIHALPLPTGERQAVLLTDEQIHMIFYPLGNAGRIELMVARMNARDVETAVLAANNLGVSRG